MSEGQYVYVKDIRPGQKNLSVLFIVLEIGKYQRGSMYMSKITTEAEKPQCLVYSVR